MFDSELMDQLIFSKSYHPLKNLQYFYFLALLSKNSFYWEINIALVFPGVTWHLSRVAGIYEKQRFTLHVAFCLGESFTSINIALSESMTSNTPL